MHLCVTVNMARCTLCHFVRVRAYVLYAHMRVRARARGVVRESDADSGVTLGLPVFLLSMKGMT